MSIQNIPVNGEMAEPFVVCQAPPPVIAQHNDTWLALREALSRLEEARRGIEVLGVVTDPLVFRHVARLVSDKLELGAGQFSDAMFAAGCDYR
jgi:hypothetical protein